MAATLNAVRAHLEETARNLDLIERKIDFYRERLARRCSSDSSDP